jgi:putative phosphoesterase
MRIALLGDIHANLPALQAVLEHAQYHDIGAIWNVGDLVGYGPFPNEVIQVLRSTDAVSICGNYDLKVIAFPEKKDKWRKSKRAEKYTAFKWAYETLTSSNRRYLAKLPEEVRIKVTGRRILLTHGSPASMDEHLTLATPVERLQELGRLAHADLVICGHSHQAFTRLVGDTLFINTGSVGRPGDGDPRAAYAILDINRKRVEVEHYRVEYDIPAVVAEVGRAGLPEAFAEMFIRGYDLDVILGAPPEEPGEFE